MDDEKPGSHNPASEACAWLSSLQPWNPDGSRNHNADPGALARIRRANGIDEIALEPAVIALNERCGFRFEDIEKTSLVAGVIALVRKPLTGPDGNYLSVGDRMGRKRKNRGGQPLLSENRLRRVLRTRSTEDVLITFRRLVRIGEESMPVYDLSRMLLNWNDPVKGKESRRRLAYDYYRALDNQ
jgi:CRISPR type I-E-associated protein CasB/Cse2